jgi:putative molybdopterin biosynthesis protein
MGRDNIYITNLPLETALKTYLDAIPCPVSQEMVSTGEALFRTTSRPVLARRSSPFDHCAAMDGIAVKAERTHGATERSPLKLMEGIDFEYVNTGNLIPQGRDAVIMIEDVTPLEAGLVEIIEAAYAWQHIRQVGEDIVEGEMVLPSGHKIRPVDLGALMSGGVSEVPVLSRLKFGIIPTGNEIVQSIDALEKGKIIDSNSHVIKGLIQELGCLAEIYPVALDDREELENAIKKAVTETDFVITIAGSSAGTKDYTVGIIKKLGEVVVHGVAIKPGKPTILGKIQDKAIVGLPGYPVSAYFAFEKFIRPLVEKWYRHQTTPSDLQAVLTQRIVSSFKNEEMIRITVGKVDDKWIATPLDRGAGATMSLVRADGVLTVPRLSEGIERGESVSVSLMKPLSQLENRLVVIGSHDLLIDLIADQMHLSSAHVGSFGGILAIRNKECHIAPIHLIDENTGIYNKEIIRKMFPAGGMSLIKGVNRLQGLIVQEGNPKGIEKFEDLTRKDVLFINRQRGAGTRQLLDFELKKRSIDSDAVLGYEREFTTHMAVAAAVGSGSADAGLGIYAAAKSMGLDFVPVGYESYDFLVPTDYLNLPSVKRFIEVLKSAEFQSALSEIGGYAFDGTGEVS